MFDPNDLVDVEQVLGQIENSGMKEHEFGAFYYSKFDQYCREKWQTIAWFVAIPLNLCLFFGTFVMSKFFINSPGVLPLVVGLLSLVLFLIVPLLCFPIWIRNLENGCQSAFKWCSRRSVQDYVPISSSY